MHGLSQNGGCAKIAVKGVQVNILEHHHVEKDMFYIYQ